MEDVSPGRAFLCPGTLLRELATVPFATGPFSQTGPVHPQRHTPDVLSDCSSPPKHGINCTELRVVEEITNTS